ncbi:DUF2474 domain-containing protein [Serratia aquatilis]|uniref:DUF2474 domain-containing protein n=1 Tax=Serratia aquatilis TaxID=1737515 RepID=A0ABV6EE59_9GAMM
MKDKTAIAPWWKRVGWLVIIWSASVFGLFLFALLFRLLMGAAGMKSS